MKEILYLQVKEAERRAQEQRDRALAMTNFQQRKIKNEPLLSDSSTDAFPAPNSSSDNRKSY